MGMEVGGLVWSRLVQQSNVEGRSGLSLTVSLTVSLTAGAVRSTSSTRNCTVSRPGPRLVLAWWGHARLSGESNIAGPLDLTEHHSVSRVTNHHLGDLAVVIVTITQYDEAWVKELIGHMATQPERTETRSSKIFIPLSFVIRHSSAFINHHHICCPLSASTAACVASNHTVS